MFKDFFNLNSPAFWTIIVKFVINLVFLFLLVRLVYYRYSKKERYVFSLFLMGVLIFILGSMLPIVFNSGIPGAQLGMAIGLFAIFTILKFRTRNLNVKDMAYFFTVIAISAVNSFKWANFPLLGVFILIIIIILSAYILEVLMARRIQKEQKAKKSKKAGNQTVRPLPAVGIGNFSSGPRNDKRQRRNQRQQIMKAFAAHERKGNEYRNDPADAET